MRGVERWTAASSRLDWDCEGSYSSLKMKSGSVSGLVVWPTTGQFRHDILTVRKSMPALHRLYVCMT